MATFEYKVRKGETLLLGDSLSATKTPGAIVKTYEKVTSTASGAINPLTALSLITSGGAHTMTLADGTFDGQVKKIVISLVAAGTITVTPANFANGTSMTMAEILDSVELVWDGSNWNIAQAAGVAII